jgi:phage repressor protein C with HTH and peptisase S24 domain
MTINEKDRYAVHVPGDCMEPQAYKGQLAVVDPHQPPTCGCLVVVALEIDGKSHAFVPQFRERNAEGFVVRSLNPEPQDETLSFGWLKHVHRIVMIGDPL